MRVSKVIPRFIRMPYAVLILAASSCLEPYNPPEISDNIDILVVDGFINSSDQTATVRLTKATPLSDISGNDTGVNALVQIEDENGFMQTLNAEDDGYYSSHVQLSEDMKYRLSIVRSDEKRYHSEFISLMSCPPIDSITWDVSTQSAGIDVFVNTHDETGRSEYFQWTFDETWEYRATYGSFFKIVDGAVVPQDLNINRCWISKPSTEILVGSSSRLSTNIIRDYPLTFIPIRSPKISVRYSILVQQRALPKEAYDFWTQLKKSTESLGGLFDPMPSQVLGNVYSATDTSEPVLGYFGGGQVSSKRIFIRFAELPPDLRFPPLYSCPVDSITMDAISSYPNSNLIASYGTPFPIGYYRSLGRNCMDCRDEGGGLIRPDFW